MSKYKPRTLTGAALRVRQLENQINQYEAICNRLEHHKQMLARLAAGHEWEHPLAKAAAEMLRDEIIRSDYGFRPPAPDQEPKP